MEMVDAISGGLNPGFTFSRTATESGATQSNGTLYFVVGMTLKGQGPPPIQRVWNGAEAVHRGRENG